MEVEVVGKREFERYDSSNEIILTIIDNSRFFFFFLKKLETLLFENTEMFLDFVIVWYS